MAPKNFTYSQKNIDALKGKAANKLIDKFQEIATSMQGNDDATKSRSMKLQEVFGESFSSPNVLLLSYQTSAHQMTIAVVICQDASSTTVKTLTGKSSWDAGIPFTQSV